MFCRRCGAQINEGAKFCHKCGAVLTMSTENNNNVAVSNKKNNLAKIFAIIGAVIFVIVIAVVTIGTITFLKGKSDSEAELDKKVSIDKKKEDEESKEKEDSIREENVKEDNIKEEVELPQDNESAELVNQERMAAYERFLDNEEAVYIEGNTKYLSDIADEIFSESNVPEWSSDEMLDTIEYAFIDCGLDGKKELAINFIGLDIYAPNDNSSEGIVISYNDGKLVCLDSWYSYARDWYEISYSGIIYGEGSGGASSGGGSKRIVDGDGDVEYIYTYEYDFCLPIYDYSFYLDGITTEYKEIERLAYYYGQDYGEDLNNPVSIYTIADKDYYVSVDNDNWERYLDNHGYKYYSEEEIQEIIEAHAVQLIGDEVKLKEINLCEEEIKWKTWVRPYNFVSIKETNAYSVEFWFDNNKKITKDIYNMVTYNRMYDFNADGVNEVVIFTEDTYGIKNGQDIIVYDVSKGTVKEYIWRTRADEYCKEKSNTSVSDYNVTIITLENGKSALKVEGYEKDSEVACITFVLECIDEDWQVAEQAECIE